MKRVVLLDDHQEGVALLAELLTRWDCDVVVAGADEACATVAAFAPDLVLIELRLPGGLALARALRDRDAELLIVALTARGVAGRSDGDVLAICDRHLVKPVDHQSLVGLLSWVDARAADRDGDFIH